MLSNLFVILCYETSPSCHHRRLERCKLGEQRLPGSECLSFCLMTNCQLSPIISLPLPVPPLLPTTSPCYGHNQNHFSGLFVPSFVPTLYMTRHECGIFFALFFVTPCICGLLQTISCDALYWTEMSVVRIIAAKCNQ